MESYLITRNADDKSEFEEKQEKFFEQSSVFPAFNLKKEISHKDVRMYGRHEH